MLIFLVQETTTGDNPFPFRGSIFAIQLLCKVLNHKHWKCVCFAEGHKITFNVRYEEIFGTVYNSPCHVTEEDI